MALIGNCSNTKYNASETETTTETITQPDGSSEQVEVPVIVETKTDYTDVYLTVKQVEIIHFINSIGDKVVNVLYHIAAYTDAETRDADQEDYLFWESGQLPTYDHSKNLYEQLYDYIKTKDGYTNLING